jgi:hypothetical protein
MLSAMAGANGLVLPATLATAWPDAPAWVTFAGNGLGSFGVFRGWLWIAALMAVVWLAPNSQELLRGFESAGAVSPEGRLPVGRIAKLATWQPSAGWAVLVGLLAAVAVLHLTRVSEFLYFQF